MVALVGYPVSAVDTPAWAVEALDTPAPAAVLADVELADLGCNYDGRSRRAVEYNGYT